MCLRLFHWSVFLAGLRGSDVLVSFCALDLNSFFRHSCFNDRGNPVATALFSFWSSCILWNSSAFTFVVFVLLLGSSSLFNLASKPANLSSILPNLFSPSSLISLIVESFPLIWH